MRILFDDQIFSMQRFGGISRYFVELIVRLNRTAGVKADLPLIYSDNQHSIESRLAFINVPFRDYSLPGKFRLHELLVALTEKNVKQQLSAGKYDIFHPTYYSSEFLSRLPKGKPFVLTVYDLTHEKIFPDYKNDVAADKRQLLEKASAVIAISEHTKKDIVEVYKIPEEKITAIHLSTSVTKDNFEKVQGLPEHYILFVGSRGGYKSFIFFVEAIMDLLLMDETLNIVCAGGGVFIDKEVQFLKEKNIESRIMQVPVNDRRLSYLYQRALMFVFPSLYEGFGIPVLEAFACGCPVILSDSSSLPEVGDEAAAYFTPGSKQSLFETIKDLLDDETKRQELVFKGKQRVKQFSWDKMAEETLRVYKSV
jgi:glycosyltransferase involved in cell wall biosynthesis